MAENILARLEKIEQRLDRIDKKLRKQAEERKMDLKEKFRLHDRAQTLLRQFEEIYSINHVFNPEKDNPHEIVKNLVNLVDVALGVKFP